MRRGQTETEFSVDERCDIPSTPGVYLFRDRQGAILYIGKSVCLKRRVASYFGRRSRRARTDGASAKHEDGRIRRMIHSARTITIHETGSELSALLLEDRLIKGHRPPYNKRQKDHLENCYLQLGGGDFPLFEKVHSADTIGADTIGADMIGADTIGADAIDSAALFGPFRDGYLVDDLVDVIHSAFGLRSCTDTPPAARCARYEIGLCLGPCRGAVSPDDYALRVGMARRFVDGDGAEVVARLEEIMERRVKRLEFEQAALIRDRIAFCRNFCRRRRFVKRFTTGVVVVRDEGGGGLTHIFVRGAHHRREGRLDSTAIDAIVAEGDNGEDRRCITDRAHIVYGWLKRVDPQGIEE